MYQQFFVLFAIMFSGYLLRKFVIIDFNMNRGLNRFIVYFSFPCLILEKIGMLPMDKPTMNLFYIVFGIGFALFAVYAGIAFLYVKARHFPKEKSGIIEFAMTAANTGFMGFPITLLFFGEKGLLLILALNSVLYIYTFTYGLYLLRRNNDKLKEKNMKNNMVGLFKLLLNPSIIALVLGLMISNNHFEIPVVIQSYLQLIGDVATPMVMIFIGSSLYGCNLLDMIKDRVIAESVIMKLLVMPVITALLVMFLPLSVLAKTMCVFSCAFPTAAMVPILTEQEGKNVEFASMILLLSTVLSMVTIPVIVEFARIVFG
ncbi:MAG: AEC family transporter [Peptostreptococcaceae bacterium]|nr:AEC family transporter [Peptostreptococcaceae bacterium]HZK62136.1 AEC family transporter [Anaerovoracaceae bacterium]